MRSKLMLGLTAFIIVMTAIVMAPPSATVAQPRAEQNPFQVPVIERVLDNGLKILVVENSTAQTASCRLFYRVGSANERPGQTGMAHFLEHLMFKGTPRIGAKDTAKDAQLYAAILQLDARMMALRRQPTLTPAQAEELAEIEAELAALAEEQSDNIVSEEIWAIYQAQGGSDLNAWTSADMTQYQVTLPGNKIELFMWLESDRMQNAIWREFHMEKNVVREERRLDENDPTTTFHEAFSQIVYGAHPYAWPVLGWHEDIENISMADATEFYRRHYVPDNAVMVIVGNVQADEVVALAQKYFGAIPRGTLARPFIPDVAQPMAGERRLVGQADTQPFVTINYYRDRANSPKEPVYQILAAVLSGPTGRLERALVRDRQIATRAGASSFPGRFMSTFDIHAETKGETTPETLLASIDAELARLVETGVTEAELQAVKNRVRLQLVDMLKVDEFLSTVIGMYEIIAGWRSLNDLFTAMDGVTAADVKTVAAEMFVPQNRAVGLLYRGETPVRPEPFSPPVIDLPASPQPVAPGNAVRHPRDLMFADAPFAPPAPEQFRVEFPNGLIVYVVADSRFPTVTATAHIRAGALWEPADVPGLAEAMGAMMKRGGTAAMDEDALDARLDELAASIRSTMGLTRGRVSMTCFDRDAVEVLKYFAEIVRRPAFRAEALSRWKSEELQGIARRNESPAAINQREFRNAIYGATSPIARLSTPGSVESIAPETLKRFHAQMVTPHRTIISIAGNFDRREIVRALLALFGDWSASAAAPLTAVSAPLRPASRSIHVFEKDSSQGYVTFGHVGIQRPHPDWVALRILDEILSTRIFDSVRNKHGLAYSAGSMIQASEEFVGTTGGYFQSKSQSVPLALKLALAEMERIRAELVPDDELETVKRGMIDGFPGQFSNSETIAVLFAEHELAGRPADHFRTVRDRIASITAENLRAVAQRHLHPQSMTVVIVGRSEEILRGDPNDGVALADLGTVTVYSAALTAPPGTAAALEPRHVVALALQALKDGDIDAFLARCSAATRAQFESDAEMQQMLRLQIQLLATMEFELQGQDISGDRASVDVMVTVNFQGQKIQRDQRLDLVRENGEWRVDYTDR